MIDILFQIITLVYGVILVYLGTNGAKELLIIGNIWLAVSILIGVVK